MELDGTATSFYAKETDEAWWNEMVRHLFFIKEALLQSCSTIKKFSCVGVRIETPEVCCKSPSKKAPLCKGGCQLSVAMLTGGLLQTTNIAAKYSYFTTQASSKKLIKLILIFPGYGAIHHFPAHWINESKTAVTYINRQFLIVQ